jgi:hypothetical protein
MPTTARPNTPGPHCHHSIAVGDYSYVQFRVRDEENRETTVSLPQPLFIKARKALGYRCLRWIVEAAAGAPVEPYRDARRGIVAKPRSRQVREWVQLAVAQATGVRQPAPVLDTEVLNAPPMKRALRKVTVSRCRTAYLMTTPSGELLRVNDLAAFCREHGVSASSVQNWASGRRLSRAGWKAERVARSKG